MRKLLYSGRFKVGRLIQVLAVGFFPLLLIGFVTNIVSASTDDSGTQESLLVPALQVTLTPTLKLETTPVFSFSLATLGYEERTLAGPNGTAEYTFRLPENWLIQAESVLNLDLSYAYAQRGTEEQPQPSFGNLTVNLNGETLENFSIEEETFDHYQLSIPLPPSLLNVPNQIHSLKLLFETDVLCEVPQNANLVIHPTSAISLSYSQQPLTFDLSGYPRPFYQRAFEPDRVRFVLPAQPTSNDLTYAIGIAAKLGNLTGSKMVISATTDLDLSELASTSSTPDDHLIVIGQPDHNQLLPLLNNISELPVSLHQRQLGLISQGPTAMAPADTFTYVFTLTNTTDDAANLSLINTLTPNVELIACDHDCRENKNDSSIIWNSKILEPNETVNLSLTLKMTEVFTGGILENTITLLEKDLGPVNADTLTSTVAMSSADLNPQISIAGEEGYFFMYNGRAVPKGDGIVQEIHSPWNEERAILVITGLSSGAVRKASQAMSSETRFPGMTGTVALIQDTLNPSDIKEPGSSAIERSFADLGYGNRSVVGGRVQKRLDYFFDLPYGWQLTDEAFVEIHFSHSQLLDYQNSGLTVELNGERLASAAFNEETADNGHVQVKLNGTNIRSGQDNRLSLWIDAPVPGECTDADQAWVKIKDSSRIVLAHGEETLLDFDLELYPYPFRLNSMLADVLFVLPDTPQVEEVENVLRLANALGNSASGKTIWPVASLASDLSLVELQNYQIIALGRPSRNALIQQVNAHLPQPFLPNSDQIDQRLDNVVLRLPMDIDLGYIQLIPSPWNEKRAFLALTGTADRGINGAIDILAYRPWALRGDLALITADNNIRTIDTRELTSNGVAAAIATAVPEVIPVVETELEDIQVAEREATAIPTPVPSNSRANVSSSEPALPRATTPAWLIPFVVIVAVITIAIFAVAFWQSRQRI